MSFPQQLIPYQETESAQDHQCAQGQTDHRIRLIDDHACPGFDKAQDVKSRVAEGGNRVEHAQLQRQNEEKVQNDVQTCGENQEI